MRFVSTTQARLCPCSKESEVWCVSSVLAWEIVADLQGATAPRKPRHSNLSLAGTHFCTAHFPMFFGGEGGTLAHERE